MGMKYFKDLNGKKDKEKRATDQILWFHVTESNSIDHKSIHGDDQVARSWNQSTSTPIIRQTPTEAHSGPQQAPEGREFGAGDPEWHSPQLRAEPRGHESSPPWGRKRKSQDKVQSIQAEPPAVEDKNAPDGAGGGILLTILTETVRDWGNSLWGGQVRRTRTWRLSLAGKREWVKPWRFY